MKLLLFSVTLWYETPVGTSANKQRQSVLAVFLVPWKPGWAGRELLLQRCLHIQWRWQRAGRGWWRWPMEGLSGAASSDHRANATNPTPEKPTRKSRTSVWVWKQRFLCGLYFEWKLHLVSSLFQNIYKIYLISSNHLHCAHTEQKRHFHLLTKS